jgi:Ca2+:H+ antiporter
MKWIYGLLLLVPVAIALELLGAGHTVILLTSAGALVPLAAVLGKATEELANYTGPRIGGLLNATLGNSAELIITIVAIREGLLDLVKASIAGSILGNVLMVLGASLLIGGIKNGRQRFDPHIAGISATMMALAVVALAIPALFSIGAHRLTPTASEFLSIGVAVVLLVLYGLFVLYTIFLHRPSEVAPVPHVGHPRWSKGLAIGVLAASTVGVVIMSEILVGAIEPVVEQWGLTELFLGVVLVPIVGNTAEHLVAVQVAAANKMDLSLGIAIGSTLQIALFVAPVLVFVSLLLGNPMNLIFNAYELAAIGGAVAIATLVSIDGESNWLEGAQLLAVYLVVVLGFFFLS